MREFNLLISIIDDVFRLNNLTPLTKNMYPEESISPEKQEEKKATTSKINVPVNSRVREQVHKIKNQSKIIKNKLFEAHQDR